MATFMLRIAKVDEVKARELQSRLSERFGFASMVDVATETCFKLTTRQVSKPQVVECLEGRVFSMEIVRR
jgi:hypothetical protein